MVEMTMGAGVGYSSGSNRNRGGSVAAKAVGSFVPQITKKSFQKFGFSTTTLLTEWSSIVGQEVADVSRPEQIKWPRLPDMRDESGTVSDRGATLILRVEAARALDIEYRRGRIIDRINSHFGYFAIAEIRLIQGPIKALPAVKGNGLGPGQEGRKVSQHEAAGDLASALERLSEMVRTRKTAR